MSESLEHLLARAGAARPELAAPGVDVVREQARRLRRTRRGLSVGVAALAVLAVVGGAQVLAPGGEIRPPSSTVRPDGSTADGFLLAGDLHAVDLGVPGPWESRPMPTDVVRSLRLLPCVAPDAATYTQIEVTGQGRHREYRYRGSDGLAGLVTEVVLTLDPAVAAATAARLRESASCRLPELRLAATGTMLLTGERIPTLSGRMGTGPVGPVTALALQGRTLVQVRTSFTREQRGVAVPGQPDWPVRVAVAAVQRATGTRQVAPSPNADARKAAQLARDGQPKDDPPAGFLAAEDLAGQGAWSVEAADASTAASGPAARILPACPGGPAPAPGVHGATTSQLYRAVQGHDTLGWVLDETVLTVRPADRQAVLDALTRAARCPAVTTELGTLTPGRAGPGTLVAGPGAAAGGGGALKAWALSGDRLIVLTSFVNPGQKMPVGSGWIDGLLGTAVRGAGG